MSKTNYQSDDIDHSSLDICVTDMLDRLPKGRPTITFMIDENTHYIWAYEVGFEPPFSHLTDDVTDSLSFRCLGCFLSLIEFVNEKHFHSLADHLLHLYSLLMYLVTILFVRRNTGR